MLADAGALLAGRRRVAVVSQSGVADFHAPSLTAALHATGAETDLFLMGDGEDAKTLATVDDLCRRLAAWGLLRNDAIVALGGGVVGDTAGFVASVYHRGIAVVQAPTTLLAQVDAAIGGKTAVNLPEGKNLVGAFHQPLGVYADVTTLTTLPPREYRAGLGEVAKYALMPGGGRVAAIVESRAASVVARDAHALTELVAACAAMKAHVVAADPQERTGIRATLNLGHTLGHALESVGGYELLHGEAVAVGLVFAARARRRAGAHRRRRRRSLPQRSGRPRPAHRGAGTGRPRGAARVDAARQEIGRRAHVRPAGADGAGDRARSRRARARPRVPRRGCGRLTP